MPERKAEIKYYNITCQKESQKLISIYTLVSHSVKSKPSCGHGEGKKKLKQWPSSASAFCQVILLVRSGGCCT